VPHPKVKIADNDGNTVAVDTSGASNALKVSLLATPTIDIGDVSLLLGGTAASTNAGTMDAQTLRVTLATDDTHWGEVGTTAASDGAAHAQLEFIGNSLAPLSNISTYSNATQSVLQFAASTTGAQYAEGDGGFLATGVRNDDLASLVSVDHDHAPFQVNADGALYVDIADGGQLDTIIDTLETTLTAIETDQAAIEVLLTGIDSDTDAIKTAVQILDNAIDGTEMQVDIVSSAALTVDLGSNNDVTVTSGSVGHDITGLASDDNDTVGTSAEKISGADGDVACKRVDIMAHPDNTGYIWVGDSAVSVDGLNGGIRLSPGDFYSMDIDNTGDIYVIATVDTENVCFNYFT
jgi:hypothetical protein